MCNCKHRQLHYRSTIFSHCQSSAYRFARETPKPRLPRVEACPSLASEWLLRCSCSRTRRKARGHHLPPTDSASDAFGGTTNTYKSAILIPCIFFILSNKKGDNVKRSDASWGPAWGIVGKGSAHDATPRFTCNDRGRPQKSPTSIAAVDKIHDLSFSVTPSRRLKTSVNSPTLFSSFLHLHLVSVLSPQISCSNRQLS